MDYHCMNSYLVLINLLYDAVSRWIGMEYNFGSELHVVVSARYLINMHQILTDKIRPN